MKQIWILSLAGLLTLGLTVGAVDVKEKDSTKTQTTKTVPPPAKKPVTPPAQSTKTGKQPAKSGSVQPTQKKYDDFIDNNHNGIDDRKENLVKKEDK
jgi:hypothetical protein